MQMGFRILDLRFRSKRKQPVDNVFFCAVMNVSSFTISIVSLCFSIVALLGVLGVIGVQILLLVKVITGSAVYDCNSILIWFYSILTNLCAKRPKMVACLELHYANEVHSNSQMTRVVASRPVASCTLLALGFHNPEPCARPHPAGSQFPVPGSDAGNIH